MIIKQISLQELIVRIATDNAESRFVARVFFVNSLKTYYALIAALSDKADIVVRISNDMFCKGEDTVPDLKVLIDYLDAHKDFTKPLTENDRKRLKDIITPEFQEVISFMLDNNCKLEQEALD